MAKYDKSLDLSEDGLPAQTGLSVKEEIIILTKTDIVDDPKIVAKKVSDFKKISKNVFTLSLFDDKMVKKFSNALVKILKKK